MASWRLVSCFFFTLFGNVVTVSSSPFFPMSPRETAQNSNERDGRLKRLLLPFVTRQTRLFETCHPLPQPRLRTISLESQSISNKTPKIIAASHCGKTNYNIKSKVYFFSSSSPSCVWLLSLRQRRLFFFCSYPANRFPSERMRVPLSVVSLQGLWMRCWWKALSDRNMC